MGKISQYIMYALMAIGLLVFILALQDSYEPMIMVSYVFFGICLLAAVAASVIGMLANPSSIKGTLIGLGAMIVVLGLSYVLAGDEVLESYGADATASVSKLSGAGIYALYLLFGLAVATIIGSAVYKMIK